MLSVLEKSLAFLTAGCLCSSCYNGFPTFGMSLYPLCRWRFPDRKCVGPHWHLLALPIIRCTIHLIVPTRHDKNDKNVIYHANLLYMEVLFIYRHRWGDQLSLRCLPQIIHGISKSLSNYIQLENTEMIGELSSTPESLIENLGCHITKWSLLISI